MAKQKAYRATVELDGRFWFVVVDGVGATQARHLRELDAMARDLVAVMTGAHPDAVSVEYEYRLPDSVQKHLDRADQLRKEYERTKAKAAAETRMAAKELRDSGLPMREIGEVMGISHQRVHQLVSS